MTKIIHPSMSKIKDRTKAIKKENSIGHMMALNVAAQEVGYPSFHSLSSYLKKLKQNEPSANIDQFNPELKSSLLVVFNDDLEIFCHKEIQGNVIAIKKSFQEEYLNKGFAERIGARLLTENELQQRNLIAPGGSATRNQEDYLHYCDYICIEFLREKNIPWTIEDADKLVIEQVDSEIGCNYREFFYLDGKLVNNHISRAWDAEWENYVDIDYHPAIDGY
ncbi:hypothetical protein [Aliivibrio wodanis]|uniref:hypothetical protein n=1 Tax=Aliivibrio wodanis TaxID=80852 RepID=UPI00406C21AB